MVRGKKEVDYEVRNMKRWYLDWFGIMLVIKVSIKLKKEC